MSSFENLRIVDNFYQTSLYYPMPPSLSAPLPRTAPRRSDPTP